LLGGLRAVIFKQFYVISRFGGSHRLRRDYILSPATIETYGKAAPHEKSLRLHLIAALLPADDSVITFP
jgi:hypothetical protein